MKTPKYRFLNLLVAACYVVAIPGGLYLLAAAIYIESLPFAIAAFCVGIGLPAMAEWILMSMRDSRHLHIIAAVEFDAYEKSDQPQERQLRPRTKAHQARQKGSSTQ